MSIADSHDGCYRETHALRLSLALITILCGSLLLPQINSNLRLSASVGGAAGALLALFLLVRRRIIRTGRVLRFQFVPRPVHYVQLAMHTSIYVYWGFYWREVYRHIPLILAQIVFVYAFDMLLNWWRRDNWILGFGPFPIVLSTNLFLWFRDDWFFLQFLMIATGVFCKEFITWTRDGRRTHIFNPSAIALFLFSICLLATRSTDLTSGQDIAVTLGRPPNMYLEIFLLGLVVQALFSVTLVTLSAALALVVLNLLYTRWTGVYHFVDTNIPIAVFLGLHLLVTDPATSPRRPFGKSLFGAMYGSGVFGMYALLSALGAPTFYDKLLCVPPLNLTVRALDTVSTRLENRLSDFKIGWLHSLWQWSARRANVAFMAMWILLFATMTSTGFTGARHPGKDPEFWRLACESGRRGACDTWLKTVDLMCQYSLARACLTEGIAFRQGRLVRRNPPNAGRDFARACELGEPGGCAALLRLVELEGPDIFRRSCEGGDGEMCYVLGSLYSAGRVVLRNDAHALAYFQQSCANGWVIGCGQVGESYRAGVGVPANRQTAITYFEKACRAGHAKSCYNAATLYRDINEGVLAQRHFMKACELSIKYTEASAAYYAPGTFPQTPAFLNYCSQRP